MQRQRCPRSIASVFGFISPHAIPVIAVSSALAGGGIFLLLYFVALEFNLAPVSAFALPDPVALTEDHRGTLDQIGQDGRLRASLFDADTAWSSHSIEEVDPPQITRTPRSQGPEVIDGPLPAPDVANMVWIPSIALNTSVVFSGVARNKSTGQPEWQTEPFVAVHYAADTALIGSQSNAVIAGHVATLSLGNVFHNLYKVMPGDRVFVKTQGGAMFAYQITSVKLTSPTAVDVMRPTADAELTLITCGGTFDPRTRTFDKRLVVTAKLVGTAVV
jgi:LPXTG-site transpeptidase (sortase) family protein